MDNDNKPKDKGEEKTRTRSQRFIRFLCVPHGTAGGGFLRE